MPRTPYDLLFKALLGQPRVIALLLPALLPAALLRRVDGGRIRLASGEFPDLRIGERRNDLLFWLPFHGGGGAYLLLEHRSHPRAGLLFDLAGYRHALWQRWTRREDTPPGLPLVWIGVVFHGPRPWRGPRQLRDEVLLPTELLEAAAPQLPALRPALLDLRTLPDEEIPGEGVARLALLLLKHGHDADLWRALADWSGLLHTLRATQGDEAVRDVAHYVCDVTGSKPTAEEWAVLDRILEDEIMEAFKSYADQLREEGQEIGLAKGRAQGRAEGRAELLLRQLRLRYGDLPPRVPERVRAAPIEQLDAWGERLLFAETLEALFGEG